MKYASQEMTNSAASDYLWTSFRKWLSSETHKLQEQSYEQIQQNFSDLLKVFDDQVLSHPLKKDILPLDNAPWSEHRPSDEVQPESESLSLTAAPEYMITTEEMVHSKQVAECSEQRPTPEETPAPSLVMQTLEELKRANVVIHERLDKQEDTNKEIKSILSKQEETNTQIKGLLESLFTRLPPPS